ncbi:helix-turn-helix domain-containing protein [Polluticaenibacter yanchengensis]|uniref:AraC family transcriptional regulator n=1 Tax=Polluticaenibacter yanchengensis TaxID=3014562 RepID=A0ABT4UHP8_9BACT|nr:AraC family transcriptional regulator [Chitinophagaceae bacterium LY-5]
MDSLNYELIKPDKCLADFVESYWQLHNKADDNKEITLLPDGKIDMIFTKSSAEEFQIILLGLTTLPDKVVLPANTMMFAISFKLLATEYILQTPVAGLLDNAKILPAGFWGFHPDDLSDFNEFCHKAYQIISSLLPAGGADTRKLELFNLLYGSEGAVTVNELSEKVFWSARQMNRYFNQEYGISLKTYCNILRFRASFRHIKDGKLYPQQNFSDQSHFIKEVKKLSGALPKQLKQNKDGRFIQFSTLGRS